MKNRLLSLVLIISSLLCTKGSLLYSQSIELSIDSLIATKFQSDQPGGVFLASRQGKVIYKKAVGLANLELGVPMQTNHVFEIGSLSKQFTAIAIMMLLEEGKLGLDDPVTKYIPDYPTAGHSITIHHLLTHTSGVKDFTQVSGLNDIASIDKTPLELIDFFKNEPMDFPPGEQYKYNNSGYVLLGYIIEVVSGASYEDFINNQIFQKVGMTSSNYNSHSKVIKNRASGYQLKKEQLLNRRIISFTLPYASGALMSTVDDMYKWQKAITNHELINKETTEKVFTNYTTSNGNPIDYGYGWHLKDSDDYLFIEHGGSIFGFKSMGVYIPEVDLYVIGFSNCDCNSPTQLVRDIARLILSR